MRISDWSSDVCSSDLGDGQHRPLERPPDAGDCGVGRVGVLEEGPVDAGRQLTVLLQRLDPRDEIAFGAFLGGDIAGARCRQLEYHLAAQTGGTGLDFTPDFFSGTLREQRRPSVTRKGAVWGKRVLVGV